MSVSKSKKKSFPDAIATDRPNTRAATRSISSTTPMGHRVCCHLTGRDHGLVIVSFVTRRFSRYSTANQDPVVQSVGPSTSTAKAPRSQSAKDQQADATRFKKDFITASTQRIEDAATFDELARFFGDVLQWTEGNKTISVEFGKHPLKPCESHPVNPYSTVVVEHANAAQHISAAPTACTADLAWSYSRFGK
ncbi:hypothetical protein B0H13DRAFT_1859003 [Mycena leptocephala]|nr:hypothetical protein B0H13DRAFT_1859003 [Mycena leptocephala]